MEPTGKRIWKEKLFDDANFNQKIPYKFDKVVAHFEKCVEDLDHLNPFEFLAAIYEFTKAFSALSTALGMGFSDITEKVELWRNLFIKFYNDDIYPDMQSIMEKEIELNIHILNGDNNKKNGHKKNSSNYFSYVSGCRTMVRLSWFLHFVMKIFRNMLDTNDGFDLCIKNAYNEALAPHHPWIIRTSVGVALRLATSKRGPVLSAFLGSEDFNETTQNKALLLQDLLEKICKYLNSWLESNKLSCLL